MFLMASPLDLEGRCLSETQEVCMNAKGLQHRHTRMLIALAMVLLVLVLSDSAFAAKDKPTTGGPQERTNKVHLDGYDQSTFLRNVSGTATNNNGTKSARDMFFYSDDGGMLVSMRQGDYKYVFAEQRLAGTMGVWAEPFTKLRLQKIYNLFQIRTSGRTSRPTRTGIG